MPTHYRGTPRESRALDAFIKLMRATDALHAELGGPLAEAGLTHSQLGILEALLFLGPMSQRELAAKVLRSSSNTTTVLDNLEKAGFVQRCRREDDRRVVDVSLTRNGKKLIEKVFPAHAARIADLFGALSPAEQAQLGELCKRLGKSIRERKT